MSGEFSCRIEQTGDGTHIVHIIGPLTDQSNFDSADVSKATTIKLDFEKVELINSLGIQKWILFVRKFPKDAKIILDNVQMRVVNQMNIFAGFLDFRAYSVAAFYAPYVCEACDETYGQKLTSNDVTKGAPAKNCPKCNKPMEFGAIESKYFLFLQNQR